jgi:hypothetical protein
MAAWARWPLTDTEAFLVGLIQGQVCGPRQAGIGPCRYSAPRGRPSMLAVLSLVGEDSSALCGMDDGGGLRRRFRYLVTPGRALTERGDGRRRDRVMGPRTQGRRGCIDVREGTPGPAPGAVLRSGMASLGPVVPGHLRQATNPPRARAATCQPSWPATMPRSKLVLSRTMAQQMVR